MVWCALVYVLESRLQANVVWGAAPFGHREIFLLLSHLSWLVKAQTQEKAVVTWLRKLTVVHPYEWRVRIRVWLTGGYRDLLMGVTWAGRFHLVWVTGTPLLMLWV